MRQRSQHRWLFLLALAACGGKDAPPRATAPMETDAGEPADAGPPVSDAEPGLLAWPEAIRLGRFDEAARGLALLTPTERSKP